MNLFNTIKASLTLFLLSNGFAIGAASAKHQNDDVIPEIVVMGYNSYDAPTETLIFSSIDENEKRNTDGSDPNIQSIGLGEHLWTIDEDGPELKRGWMFRLRLTMQHVKDEYERRNKQDFVVVIADSLDVYVKESLDQKTLHHLNERFLTEFSDHKIVFSTQIYCCNPWELREFGRRDWDAYYNKRGGDIPSMYKHLNAGTFMGYASAIIEMADEMKLWNTTYHRHEGFHSLAGLESSKGLRMIDLEVDDDEWQLAAWFFQDQDKEVPLATLDYYQDLFAVTGTFRAQELDDESYVAFPRNHFYEMFGPFPETFDKNTDMDQLVVCPYEYDASNMEFTNKITGGHPFIFHFAGNDWLCACKVFAEVGFVNVPKKFRENCEQRHSFWYDRVEEGILYIAGSTDDTEMLQLHRDTIDIEEDVIVQEERRLERFAELEDRDLQSVQPYRRPVRRFFRRFRRGGDDRDLVEEMDRDLQSVQPYRRPARRIFRRFRRGGDDRDLVEEEMDRDLQSVQPYRRPVRRFFRRFRRGGDDRDLVGEEMDRELKRMKPYKQKHDDDRKLVEEEIDRTLKRIKPYKKKNEHKRDDDRELAVEEIDRELQSVQPYRRPIRRFFRRYFRGGDDRNLVEDEIDRELKQVKPYQKSNIFRPYNEGGDDHGDDRKLFDVEIDRDLQSLQPYRRPVRRFFRRFRRGGDDRNLLIEDEMDHELIDEEMNRELKRIKPYKKKNKRKGGDDRE